MIYLEPTSLGWRPILKSWIHVLPEILKKEAGDVIVDIFEWLVDPCLDFIRHNCKVRARESLAAVMCIIAKD